MKAPAVRLYIRVRLDDGRRAFLDPVISANGKLKPGYALRDGVPHHDPNGVYHLRYLKAGKRVWAAVGTDAQKAMLEKDKLQKTFEATALGIQLIERPSQVTTKRSLVDCIVSYLAEVKDHREAKTYSAYRKVSCRLQSTALT